MLNTSSTSDSPAILLVDDVGIILRSLERLLKRENYRIFLAASGDEALRIMERHEIALIISDHSMPGMSGIELLEKVHEIYPSTVRVLLTGNADFNVASGAINRSGVYRFLTKPVDYAEILQTVRLALTFHQINNKLTGMPGFLSRILSVQDEQMICSEVQEYLSMPAVVSEMTATLKVPDTMPKLNQNLKAGLQRFRPIAEKDRSIFVDLGFEIYDQFSYFAVGVFCDGNLAGFLVVRFNDSRKDVWILDDVLKNTRNHLVSTVADMLGLVISNFRLKSDLHQQSIIDELTGIYNRRHFEMRLAEETSRANRYESQLALIIFDIDKFKDINDNFGHLAGDSVLNQIGDALQHLCRKSDVLCRYGGDEFVVLLPETDLDHAAIKAQLLRELIASYSFESDSVKLQITISIGVSAIGDKHLQPFDLFEAADKALYRAKEKGRNLAYKNDRGRISAIADQ